MRNTSRSEELKQLFEMCAAESLAIDMQRKYNLKRRPHINIVVEFFSHPAPMSTWRMTTVAQARVRDYYCRDSKDHFLMQLRDNQAVLEWLRDRSATVVEGLLKTLEYEEETKGSDPEESLRRIQLVLR